MSVTPGARPGQVAGAGHIKSRSFYCFKAQDVGKGGIMSTVSSSQLHCSTTVTLVRVRRHSNSHSVNMFRNSSLSLGGWVPTCPVSGQHDVQRCTERSRFPRMMQTAPASPHCYHGHRPQLGATREQLGGCGPCAMLCEMCDVLVGGCVV